MDEVPLHASFAPTATDRAVLGPNELHVWAVPMHGDPDPYVELLSKSERERASRFHFADHRRRYQIGHGALRQILAGYLGKRPASLEFTHGPRGKPYLVERGPYFSLSHSGKLALIGICGVELGVDCEKVRHLESFRGIAEKHFSATEFAGLDATDRDQQLLAFYRCWTRKEAYIKALGEGLAMALDTFDVSLCEEPRFLAIRDGREDPAKWSMLDVSPGPDFVAAAALRGHGVVVRRFQMLMG